MKSRKQKNIAEKLSVTESYISQLVNTKKRPNWPTAKKLAQVTKPDPILWLEGSPEEIKQALSNPKKQHESIIRQHIQFVFKILHRVFIF